MDNVFSLNDLQFPLLIKDVLDNRFTGIIFVNSRQLKKGIIFREGRLSSIQSNNPAELLGSILKDMGVISEKENTLSLSKARVERKKQGEILLNMGIITPDHIKNALRKQIKTRFMDIFTWETGTVQKIKKNNIDKAPELTRQELDTLIIQGILDKAPFSVIIDALSPFADARPRILKDHIPYDTGVDAKDLESYRVSEILLLGQDLPRALLGLYCTGIITLEESKYKSLIENLRHKLKDLRDKDPVERLGIDTDASDTTLKKAYINIVKENHPDIYSFADDPEVKHLSNEIFTLIQATYTSLLREREGSPPEKKEIEPEVRAEILFSQATDALKSKDYLKAIDLFKLCIKLNPEEQVFMESLIKAMFLKWQKAGLGSSIEIKRLIRDGINRFPRSDAIYVVLGWVLKKENSNRAVDAFRKALKINPDNPDAQREMRLHHIRSK